MSNETWKSVAAVGDWCRGVPKGMVGVTATPSGRLGVGPKKQFLVPAAEYKPAMVIDLQRHVEMMDAYGQPVGEQPGAAGGNRQPAGERSEDSAHLWSEVFAKLSIRTKSGTKALPKGSPSEAVRTARQRPTEYPASSAGTALPWSEINRALEAEGDE